MATLEATPTLSVPGPPQSRKSLPMYFPLAPFNLQDVLTCSLLVDTAYDQFTRWVAQGKPSQDAFKWNPKAAGFTYSAPFWWTYKIVVDPFIEPFGFVAQAANGDSFLVFRGTETEADGAEDARTDQVPYTFVPGYGSVHAGFFGIYNVLRPQVLAAVKALNGVKRFFFSGHSLGSGLSTLAVPDVITNTPIKPSADLPVCHYNLASPRVGDPTFGGMMNFSTNVPTYRVVNTEDVVPDAPLPAIGSLLFEHVGTSVDYTAQYGSIPSNHDHWNSYNYALNHPDQPQGPVSAPGNRIIGPTSLKADFGAVLKVGTDIEQAARSVL